MTRRGYLAKGQQHSEGQFHETAGPSTATASKEREISADSDKTVEKASSSKRSTTPNPGGISEVLPAGATDMKATSTTAAPSAHVGLSTPKRKASVDLADAFVTPKKPVSNDIPTPVQKGMGYFESLRGWVETLDLATYILSGGANPRVMKLTEPDDHNGKEIAKLYIPGRYVERNSSLAHRFEFNNVKMDHLGFRMNISNEVLALLNQIVGRIPNVQPIESEIRFKATISALRAVQPEWEDGDPCPFLYNGAFADDDNVGAVLGPSHFREGDKVIAETELHLFDKPPWLTTFHFFGLWKMPPSSNIGPIPQTNSPSRRRHRQLA